MLIAPSILAADFACLGATLEALEPAGADWVHLDVMDGRFVPNLTFGPPVIKALRPHTKLFFDAHLMIEAPDSHLEAFAAAGCDAITVHAEATPHLHRTLGAIKQLGKRAGVAYNPATPIDGLPYVLDELDLILIMSVNPGFGGQTFIEAVLPKVRAVHAMILRSGRPIHLAIDGGIDSLNAARAAEAGCDVLVAGSAIFGGPGDWGARIRTLRQSAASKKPH